MFLSSFLIYNSLGNIDEKALDSLSLIVNSLNFLSNYLGKFKQIAIKE